MTEALRLLRIGAESAAIDPMPVDGIERSLALRQIDPPATASALPGLADADAVLVDTDAPAPETIDWIRARSTSIPVFVAVDDAETADAAFAAGATDVVSPAELADGGDLFRHRLARTVEDAPAESASGEPATPYRTLVESAGDPMYVLDASGTCTVANDALAGYAGYDSAELIGMHAAEIIGEENFERATDLLGSLIETGEQWGRSEFRFETAGGDLRICETTLIVLYENGAVAGSAGVVRDVSERERRGRELAQYETIVETAPIGLFVLDEDARISWANEEFIQVFAETESELLGIPFPELIDRGYFEPESIPEYVDNVRTLLSSDTDEKVVNHEVRFSGPDGERHRYEASVALLPLDDGEFCGSVHAFRNVTAQRTYERELERQNDRLEQFASLVSHDLRNPLNVAQGHANVIAGEVDHESVSEVAWALDRMAELIDDLLGLAWSGDEVRDPTAVALDDVVDDAWTAVDTADASLEIDGIEDVTIVGDAGRIKRLLENLIRNSVEHGPPEERQRPLSIRVGWLDGEPADDDTSPDGSLFIEDDGRGLPDDVDIFESGVTTNEEGTGLGLAIVAEIADAHGWELNAIDRTEGGARFEFGGITQTVGDG